VSAAVPEGPKLVGYALVRPVMPIIASLYKLRGDAEFAAGFAANQVQPLYTLPDELRGAWVPTLRQKLTWGITGAVLMAIACVAAVVIGGAV
jgi:hypothetical protein